MTIDSDKTPGRGNLAEEPLAERLRQDRPPAAVRLRAARWVGEEGDVNTPWHDDGQSRLYLGDSRAVLRTLPPESVQTVVTSPPYWGLRSYAGEQDTVWGGDAACEHEWTKIGQASSCACGAWLGHLGQEPAPGLFVEHIVEVMRDVRRVLRPDGTLWLNLGDSYSGSWGNYVAPGSTSAKALDKRRKDRYGTFRPPAAARDGRFSLKSKDLVGIPWRVAFALQEDGWWLRSDIIFAKPNPMPESVKDRPSRAHEYVFLLAKSASYYYDAEAIREQSVSGHPSGDGYKRAARLTYQDENGARGSEEQWQPQASRNARDVWSIAVQPTPEAHFATFPDALARRCVLAGSAPGDVVLDPFCGSGTTMRVAKQLGRIGWGIDISEEYLEIARRKNAQMGMMVPQ